MNNNKPAGVSQNSSATSGNENETLSALHDGEMSELDMHRSLSLLENEESRQRLRRYQMISAGLRGEEILPCRDMSRAISEALEEEQTYHFTGRNWQMGRFAVAASVALSVVFGAQFWGADSSTSSDIEPAAMAAVPSGFAVPSLSARVASDTRGVGTLESRGIIDAQSVPVQVVISQEEVQRRLQWLLQRQAEQQAIKAQLDSLAPVAQ